MPTLAPRLPRLPRRLLVLAAALVTLPATSLRAAEKGYKPCSLLTAAEIETALGAKVGTPSETDTPYKKGPAQDHDGVLSACSWSGEGRTIFLGVSTAAVTSEGKERGKKAKRDSEENLRKQGMTVERKAFGPVECSILTPGKGQKAPRGTTCEGEKGPLVYFLSVSTKVELPPVPMERLKGLAEKAASRLR